MKRYIGFKIFGVIGFVAIAVLGAGLLVMFLWNSLMPVLFGLPAVTFVQALGLLLLSRILFGGFSHRGRSGRHSRRKWKHRMKDKWANMSPEERTAFKQKMSHWRSRGCWPEEEAKPEEEGEAKEEDLV